MLNVSKSDVVTDPFPHVISQNILDADVYAALRADYPTAEIFESQKRTSGTTGSRTGQGFDIYRGDESYDRLMDRSQAWRDFDAFINSRRFVEKFLELFGDLLPAMSCKAEISPDRFDRDLIEPRHVMTEKETLRDRVSRIVGMVAPAPAARKPVRLFTRLDIHKALTGYGKTVHCDRPNRLCSFIVYFCDAEKSGLKGGDLTIHKHVQQKPIGQYERHPRPENAPVVAILRPRENQGVFFPCCNNSYHGVTPVETTGTERDYLYINISAETQSLW
jgi:hypothetical protein